MKKLLDLLLISKKPYKIISIILKMLYPQYRAQILNFFENKALYGSNGDGDISVES